MLKARKIAVYAQDGIFYFYFSYLLLEKSKQEEDIYEGAQRVEWIQQAFFASEKEQWVRSHK